MAQTPSQPVKAARRLPLRTENAKSGCPIDRYYPAAPVIVVVAARDIKTAETHNAMRRADKAGRMPATPTYRRLCAAVRQSTDA
uniref:Uncharacterized protein n=1 Tax=Burkholderia orbicola (strain AU 1054) TaxID=331271 RepID=A0A0H2XNE1_BURO1